MFNDSAGSVSKIFGDTRFESNLLDMVRNLWLTKWLPLPIVVVILVLALIELEGLYECRNILSLAARK